MMKHTQEQKELFYLLDCAQRYFPARKIKIKNTEDFFRKLDKINKKRVERTHEKQIKIKKEADQSEIDEVDLYYKKEICDLQLSTLKSGMNLQLLYKDRV